MTGLGWGVRDPELRGEAMSAVGGRCRFRLRLLRLPVLSCAQDAIYQRQTLDQVRDGAGNVVERQDSGRLDGAG